MSRCPQYCTFENADHTCIRCGLPPRDPRSTGGASRTATANEEIARFVRAVGARTGAEVWEPIAGRQNWWRLATSDGARALVRPGHWRGKATYAWGVQLATRPALRTGHAPTEHDAMRAAERVLEEER